jgi:hypothetical protein
MVMALLAGCGGPAAAAQRAPAASAGTPTPTAASQPCSANAGSATRQGDLLVSAEQAFSGPSRKLPQGIPLNPFQIPNPNDTAALNALIPVSPAVPIGPGVPVPPTTQRGTGLLADLLINICNASMTKAHIVEGGTLQITSFTPFAGSVNTWHICDGTFTRSLPAGGTGGCGATSVFDEDLRVTFPPEAGVGFTQTAVQISQGTSPNGFGPLPVSLPPGKSIRFHLSISPPEAFGTYTFAFSLMADHAQMALIPALSPTLFAPIAHKFTGAACLTPPMQQQIPLQVTPALFFICPEGVFVVPTSVPGKG